VVWVGVPVLAATLWTCRRLAGIERGAVERVLGRPLPSHHYRTPAGRLPNRMLRSLGGASQIFRAPVASFLPK